MWQGRTTYGDIDGPRRPSMAAVLGPGGPLVAINIATDGPGDLFWGDHHGGGMTEQTKLEENAFNN